MVLDKGNFELILRLVAFTLISVLLINFFANFSTLLYQQFLYDYAVFKVIGNAWGAGYIPYRDFFDHKGPFLYLIQMFASVIPSPKAGLFVLELIWIVATWELLFRCGRYVGASKTGCYFSVIVAMLIYACFVDGGNTVEVWSLPFQVLPLLLCLRYLVNQKHLATMAFVSGVCFGIVAFIRLNNNALIVGIVIGMIIFFCMRHQFSQIFDCAVWFLLGMLLAMLPFVLYFWIVGALDDMIYCVFTFNLNYLNYAGGVGTQSVWDFISIHLFPCVLFLPIICLFSIKRDTRYLFVLSPAAIIIYLTFCHGFEFPHYYLMTIPIAALSIQLIWSLGRFYKVSVLVLYALLCGHRLCVITPIRFNYIREMRSHEAEFGCIAGRQFIAEYIPDSDKASVYIYGKMEPAAALVVNGYFPVGKYFFMQDFLQEIDYEVLHDSIIEKFKEAHPKWIIAQSEDVKLLEGNMDGFVEIPRCALPVSCPESWRIFVRK